MGGGDDAGANSGACPGGNGHGCVQIPWIITPTLPPGNLCSWFPIVVVSHSPFAYHLCSIQRSQCLHPLIEMWW